MCNTKRKGRSLNKITFAVVLGIAVVGATVRADEKITYRDAQGRIQGTVTIDRYGKTTYFSSAEDTDAVAETAAKAKFEQTKKDSKDLIDSFKSLFD